MELWKHSCHGWAVWAKLDSAIKFKVTWSEGVTQNGTLFLKWGMVLTTLRTMIRAWDFISNRIVCKQQHDYKQSNSF